MSQPAERYCPSCEKSFHDGRLCPEDGTELVVIATRADPLLGRSLNDRYTINERLGAGGMGTVYRGTQHSVGRDVAIKVVSAALVAEPDAIKRFLREAKLASRLSHPNAVSVLDFGQTPDGVFYLVMELLSGTTLDHVVKNEGRLRLSRVARIAQQVCDALEGAHRMSVIHRDLKPANVMLLEGSEGRDLIKVLDFGLAKSLSKDTTSTTVTVSGALLGTPAYMSPEAATGGEVDERSDLYSLGCMLYALATGRPPFQSDKMHELLTMQSNSTPLPLTTVPPPVAAVIMKLLEKDPSARFRTAAATRHALDEATLPYLSRDLETANANTLPGRKKSMPPVVQVNAPTLAESSVGSTKAAPNAKLFGADAMAATVTPAMAIQPAAVTPMPAAVTPTPAAFTPTPAAMTPMPAAMSAAAETPAAPMPAAMTSAAAETPAASVAAGPSVASAVAAAPSVSSGAAATQSARPRRRAWMLATGALLVIAGVIGFAVLNDRGTSSDDEVQSTDESAEPGRVGTGTAEPGRVEPMVIAPADAAVMVTVDAPVAATTPPDALVAKPATTKPAAKVRPPKTEPPKTEPPKTEPPKTEPPKTAPTPGTTTPW